MPRTVVFAAYGTLFDVAAAARRLSDELADADFAAKSARLSRDWRDKQLQYTWIRALTQAPADFWAVTEDALDWALEASDLAGAGLRDRLLDLYWTLDAYPEVGEVVSTIKNDGAAAAILSNGTEKMLDAALESAGLADRFDAVLSVELAGVFKPASAVYDLVEARLGASKQDVVFVSANGWDAAAARGYGFETAWVNRAGEPADRLPWRPDVVIGDLTAVPAIMRGERPG